MRCAAFSQRGAGCGSAGQDRKGAPADGDEQPLVLGPGRHQKSYQRLGLHPARGMRAALDDIQQPQRGLHQ